MQRGKEGFMRRGGGLDEEDCTSLIFLPVRVRPVRIRVRVRIRPVRLVLCWSGLDRLGAALRFVSV